MTRQLVTFAQVYLIHCLPRDVGHGSVYENIETLFSAEKRNLKRVLFVHLISEEYFYGKSIKNTARSQVKISKAMHKR